MSGDLGYFQDLLPSLSERQRSKQAQYMENVRASLFNLQKHRRNASAQLQLQNQVKRNNRHNSKVLDGFFQGRETNQLNRVARDQQKVAAALGRQYGKEQAEGILAVQNANRGIQGTGLASQINQAQAFRVGQIEGQVITQEQAERHNQVGNARGFVSAAFSNLALDLPLTALDYSETKRQEFRRRSFGKALLKDGARLVATFYGGKYATQAIDAHNGYEDQYQRQSASMQGALNAVYGENAPQLVAQSRPQFSALVGSLRGGDWQQGLLDSFTGQKDGNNSGLTGQQFGSLFGSLSNLTAGKGKTQAPQGSLNGMSPDFKQGFSIGGYTGGTKSVGNGGGFDFSQMKNLFSNFNFGSFFGG